MIGKEMKRELSVVPTFNQCIRGRAPGKFEAAPHGPIQAHRETTSRFDLLVRSIHYGNSSSKRRGKIQKLDMMLTCNATKKFIKKMRLK